MIKKNKRNIDKISYYESEEFPLFHIVVVDNMLYWGLVNYNKEDDDMNRKRGYLIFPVKNEFSKKILEKYEKIKNNCGSVF